MPEERQKKSVYDSRYFVLSMNREIDFIPELIKGLIL